MNSYTRGFPGFQLQKETSADVFLDFSHTFKKIYAGLLLVNKEAQQIVSAL